MVDLTPTAVHARAFDVNNEENVVGGFNNNAFRWTMLTDTTLLDSANSGSAYGLNSSSQVIGARSLGATNRTLQWDAANSLTIHFNPFSTWGLAINDSNEFVGFKDNGDGYFYDGTTLTTLHLDPTDLNNSRQIVGAVDGLAAIVDIDSTETILLGKLSPIDSSSDALGINDAGTIVGRSGATGAFIFKFSIGSLQNLTSLLVSEADSWKILAADDINNKGQIVGVGRINGAERAVLLTPVPPPLPGDYNRDGEVDAADYTTWRDAVGSPTLHNRNPEAIGEVGFTDYDYWQAHFGDSVDAASFATVPEPASILQVLVALIISIVRRRE